MNKHDNDKLWMAYLDGELSAAEAAAFDSALTDTDRERMSREMRLEQALAECLGAGGGCPDALWKRTELLLRKQDNTMRRPGRRYWSYLAGAAVAACLIAGFFFVPWQGAAPAAFLAMQAPTVSALADTTEVPARSDAVNDFLREKGVPLAVASFAEVRPASMHGVELLGARGADIGGEPVLELLYNCCGRPAKIVLAPKGSAAADRILEAQNDMEAQLAWYAHDHSPAEGPYKTGLMGVQETREIDGFVAGVVSVHPTDHLLHVLTPQPIIRS